MSSAKKSTKKSNLAKNGLKSHKKHLKESPMYRTAFFAFLLSMAVLAVALIFFIVRNDTDNAVTSMVGLVRAA